MIDIHSHLIQENSCDGYYSNHPMIYLKAASKLGIKDIIITPINSKFRYIKQKQQSLIETFNSIKQQLEQELIPVKLHLGYENDDCESIFDQINDNHSLANSKYMLIDFTTQVSDMDELVYNFNILKRYLILSHPEKYKHLSIRDIKALKNRGVLVQVTARFLKFNPFNKYSVKCRKLLSLGMVDFIASSGRDIKDISDYAWAYRYVQKKYGLATAQTIFESNPRKIIENIDFEREK